MLERYYGSKKEFENYLNKTYDPVKFMKKGKETRSFKSVMNCPFF